MTILDSFRTRLTLLAGCLGLLCRPGLLPLLNGFWLLSRFGPGRASPLLLFDFLKEVFNLILQLLFGTRWLIAGLLPGFFGILLIDGIGDPANDRNGNDHNCDYGFQLSGSLAA